MKWRKLGLVFSPVDLAPWMRSHAANPVAENLGGNVCRVYFSTRNENNHSSIAWVEIHLGRPCEVLRIAEQPVLCPGRIGAFDDSGASMGWLVNVGSRRYLYYLGWNLGVTVPWRNSIGLAVSEGIDKPFTRVSEAPVMDRSAQDPFSISYPCVLVEGGVWKMWYGSNLDWGRNQSDMAHLLKHAESDDGINWRRDGSPAVKFRDSNEYAISKPSVIHEHGRYRMWYSFRGQNYRIGYAESLDGRIFERMDHLAGISPSESGWDSESTEYPCVFDSGGSRYMLYNGNGYGRTGFGIAVLEQDEY